MALSIPATPSTPWYLFRRGRTRAGLKDLIYFYNLAEKKINYYSQRFFLISFLYFTAMAPKTMDSHPSARSPDGHPSSPYSPPLSAPVFGWLLCVTSLTGGGLRSQCIFYSRFFLRQIRRLQRLDAALPHVSTPACLLSNIPSTVAANS
jgi:hypothetical protein